MQVTRDIDTNGYTIYGYGAGEITVTVPRRLARPAPEQLEAAPAELIRRETLHGSLIIMPDRLITDWPPQRYEELAPAHFEPLSTAGIEVVLFGSGARLRRPEPALFAALIEQGVGVEVMDTGAACRTYNILMADRRRVAAALLMIEG